MTTGRAGPEPPAKGTPGERHWEQAGGSCSVWSQSKLISPRHTAPVRQRSPGSGGRIPPRYSQSITSSVERAGQGGTRWCSRLESNPCPLRDSSSAAERKQARPLAAPDGAQWARQPEPQAEPRAAAPPPVRISSSRAAQRPLSSPVPPALPACQHSLACCASPCLQPSSCRLQLAGNQRHEYLKSGDKAATERVPAQPGCILGTSLEPTRPPPWAWGPWPTCWGQGCSPLKGSGQPRRLGGGPVGKARCGCRTCPARAWGPRATERSRELGRDRAGLGAPAPAGQGAGSWCVQLAAARGAGGDSPAAGSWGGAAASCMELAVSDCGSRERRGGCCQSEGQC